MPKVYCKNCGMNFSDVRTFIINTCQLHPGGHGKRHEPAL